MKVVLFCGGMGTRMREFSETIPKPLVNVGNRPIIWHLMRHFAQFGHTDFVLCLGYKGELIQQINPIFQDARPSSPLDYRAPFFVAKKNFLGLHLETYKFDLMVIWVMSLLFYITLYIELLKKVVDWFGKVNIPTQK